VHPLAHVAFFLFVPTSPSRVARAMDCSVSGYEPVATRRDAAIVEAGSFASTGHYADARAVYLWVLARYPEDAEALFGLARVDSWGGCWALAEGEYRRVLAAHPSDADVRSGYVDLLVWRGRLDEAEETLRAGMALAPHDPSLVARAARFASWRGDATAAVRLADQAEKAAPDDGDLRAMRDRMFLGEARLTAHADLYPPGYQSLYSIAAQGLERVGRFEFSAGAELLARYSNADANQAVRDGRFPLSLAYHPMLGATLGIEVAPAAPAQAIPRVSLKGWALSPILGPVDAFFAYSFWDYDGGQAVHIFNPSIGVDLPREVRLDVRAWISVITLPGDSSSPGRSAQTSVEGAVGLAAAWTASPRIALGATYTYGAEADRAIAVYQLLEFHSHVWTAFVDWLLGRQGGLRPLLGAEYRLPAKIAIWSFELGAYGRW
jgi:tetratricopeptide (TPR) repeat protein